VRTNYLVTYRQHYLNGFEFRQGPKGNAVIEAVYHSEGRVAYTAGANPLYEYSIEDHLGNTRLTFCDLNSDGAIQTPSEILQENHYYPFGLALNGPWMNNVAPDNLYQYNGKELQPDHGLGWYDYGARMYMPELGRWNGVDALGEKYVNISTYLNPVNEPILFIDPSSMSISNYYEEGSILNDFTPEADSENLEETMGNCFLLRYYSYYFFLQVSHLTSLPVSYLIGIRPCNGGTFFNP
jgi:RHS repeat-associated protein